MVEHISADLLNAQLDTIISTTCKAKSTPKMYLNYADSVKKNQKPLTTYLMNAPQQARFDILHNQPIINTLNWNSEDIIAFSHIPVIDEAMTFE